MQLPIITHIFSLQFSLSSIETHKSSPLLSRFELVAVPIGASDQQCSGQPGGAAACPVLPAAPQPSPARSDAAVSQPHGTAAVHGDSHTLTQLVPQQLSSCVVVSQTHAFFQHSMYFNRKNEWVSEMISIVF